MKLFVYKLDTGNANGGEGKESKKHEKRTLVGGLGYCGYSHLSFFVPCAQAQIYS